MGLQLLDTPIHNIGHSLWGVGTNILAQEPHGAVLSQFRCQVGWPSGPRRGARRRDGRFGVLHRPEGGVLLPLLQRVDRVPHRPRAGRREVGTCAHRPESAFLTCPCEICRQYGRQGVVAKRVHRERSALTTPPASPRDNHIGPRFSHSPHVLVQLWPMNPTEERHLLPELVCSLA